jgi:multiple sugar transport system ATP-binding protein
MRVGSGRAASEAEGGADSAGLELRNIRKSFGSLTVLNDVSLTIAPTEFVAFLGPSGCGKTTLLRVIAGLENADAGELYLHGRRIDQILPRDRGIAMVFQSYALYPHMSVRENMAFGLRNAGVPKNEIDARVADAVRVLEIEALLERKPGQLSGGQQQRVAIGRAIVKKPKLFLFDEPLSNLDAALRMRTRLEFAELRQRVDATMIMVTHDQVEAMTLADRIVLIKDGKIQQIGTPLEIYSRPSNAFVARFVGSPPMTLVPVELIGDKDGCALVRLGDGTIVVTRVLANELSRTGLQLGIRPENVSISRGSADGVKAMAFVVERLGDRTMIYAELADGTSIAAQDKGLSEVRVGDTILLQISGEAAHLFDEDELGHHATGQVP